MGKGIRNLLCRLDDEGILERVCIAGSSSSAETPRPTPCPTTPGSTPTLSAVDFADAFCRIAALRSHLAMQTKRHTGIPALVCAGVCVRRRKHACARVCTCLSAAYIVGHCMSTCSLSRTMLRGPLPPYLQPLSHYAEGSPSTPRAHSDAHAQLLWHTGRSCLQAQHGVFAPAWCSRLPTLPAMR